MSYFADPIDLIPDHFPGIGFLDDAMFVEIVIRELNAEIEAYDEFCQFRSAEERKRSEAGEDPDENRTEWITPKREELQAQIKEIRGGADEEFVFHLL